MSYNLDYKSLMDYKIMEESKKTKSLPYVGYFSHKYCLARLLII